MTARRKKDPTKCRWKTCFRDSLFGWDGIRFTRPPKAWPARLDKNFVFFVDEENQPLFSAKWTSGSNRNLTGDRFENDFSRIIKKYRKNGQPLRSEPLPAELSTATPEGYLFRQAVFEQGKNGYIIYTGCPVCGGRTLMEFHIGSHRLAMRILEKFSDHHQNHENLWAVYDIQALLPGDWERTGFRFVPGDLSIRFNTPFGEAALWRFSPADELLRDSGLREFAQKRFALVDGNSGRQSETEYLFSRNRFTKRFGPKPLSWLKLWFLPDQNRIMGISANTRKPVDGNLFHQLAENYEALPPTG